ncbi:MAG: flagellar biosynthesis repressor FlbT [Devosiaceae bacterium]|nr:flagellar biosynthesis repressor FlbT [Devosiaceae bacterium MH13]
MALKVELKPGERIIIGQSVVTNDNQRTRLFIKGTAPILREKDILTPETATSPARRVYFAVQLMYLEGDVDTYSDEFIKLAGDYLKAAPSSAAIIERINNKILTGELYKALKEAKALISHEEERLPHAKCSGDGLRANSENNSKPAGA